MSYIEENICSKFVDLNLREDFIKMPLKAREVK